MPSPAAAAVASLTSFSVAQHFTMMVNRYDIVGAGPDGTEQVLAFAQQKRMAFREEVVFSTDSSRSERLFSFKARQISDLHTTIDVFDADGTAIGWFKKDFAQSLLRSTWHLGSGDVQATGQERSLPVALIRRFVDSLPLPFHFDFRDEAGTVVMSSERAMSLRDRYQVTVPGGRIDGRVAAAMAVALDALQGR